MFSAAALLAKGATPKAGPTPSPNSSGDSDVPLGTQASALQASATSSGAKKPGPKPGTKYKTRVYKNKPGPKVDSVIKQGNQVVAKATPIPVTAVKHTPVKLWDAAEVDHKKDSDVRRRHEVEQARLDGKKVMNPDVKRPFSSIDDVVERLLPYHVLASYGPDEMDLEQWEKDESPLLCSRAQAWKELITGRVTEFSSQMTQQIERFNRVVRRKQEGHVPGEEKLLAAKLLIEDERAKLAVEKKLRQEELDRRMAEKRAEEERQKREAERVRLEAERVRAEQERVKKEEERVRAEEERVRREGAVNRATPLGESDGGGAESPSEEGDAEGNSREDEDESEDDSDGADILINKPSHTTDGSELMDYNNPYAGSADWTKQGPGSDTLRKGTGSVPRDGSRTSGID